MANKMLIDATHAEETRVVVVRGNRVEDFDFETQSRRPLKGNIYLAKVTRVEPSLQAAFIEYGGNRHGFLAFSEIHPDYYQIPVADRQALIEEEARAARDADDEPEERGRGRRRPARNGRRRERSAPHTQTQDDSSTIREEAGEDEDVLTQDPAEHQDDAETSPVADEDDQQEHPDSENESEEDTAEDADDSDADDSEDDSVEQLGGDSFEEMGERKSRAAPRRYKIQEVIKRRQIMLVQVVKEERGNKGAALTTYLSLAGRYSVLMPNTARGGGISRKITDSGDRKRLKEVAGELEVPEGMGVILRTAGANRTKVEIKRDFEYLMRLWETVRDLTLKSVAPTLVYEEGSLIKRSIRDLYNKDIDEVIVEGEEGHKLARDFMRMLMPSHAKNVKLYKDSQALFTRYGVESQLDAMFSPVVQLRSGGYIVLNQTEALVAIDVNSGRATREHNIEDTAFKTNLEATEEVARQLRLRDLAGLIVIDFIDMEENRNNRTVERRLKECLKNDRARIQVGRISHFGLMEMSRQRLRSSMFENTTVTCPTCGGTGHIRSTSSVALQLLRQVEDMLIKSATHNLLVRTRAEVALYVLNNKRGHLHDLESRFGIQIMVQADETQNGVLPFSVDRGEMVRTPLEARQVRQQLQDNRPVESVEEEEVQEDDALLDAEEGDDRAIHEPREGEEAADGRKRRRRRRRGGRRSSEEGTETTQDSAEPEAMEGDEGEGEGEETFVSPPSDERENGRPRRRRGRRGGRKLHEDGAPEETIQSQAEENVNAVAARSTTEAPSLVASQPVIVEPQLPPIQLETVREKPARPHPPAEPVITSSADPATPRRSGWWKKKIFGET